MERLSAADLRRIPQDRRGEFLKTQTQGPKASRSCPQERAATTMTTHANIYPTFTIKDFAKAHGQRPQNRGSANACRHVHMGAWSSGTIRASGARGRGFDSRSSPAGQSRDARNPQRRPNRCSTSASRTRRPRRAASTTAGRSRRTARSSFAGRRMWTAPRRAST